MGHVLSVLFAVLDCGVWSHERTVAWADQLILKLRSPCEWLIDLSLSKLHDDAVAVVRKAMKDSSVQLPTDIGGLMAGFVLLRHNRGELSSSGAKSRIVDIADAYGLSGVDPEKAGDLELDSSAYARFRAMAVSALAQISDDKALIQLHETQ